MFDIDVGLIGGGGRVGLPLALMLASRGMRVHIYDRDPERVDHVRRGVMPFLEEDAEPLLDEAVRAGRLTAAIDDGWLHCCRYLVLIVGTPVDEHLNPTFGGIFRAIDDSLGQLRDGQVLIVRSTVFPGMSQKLQARLDKAGLRIGVACCPERVAQGHSLREFQTLPQIVSAFDAETLEAARSLFGRFACELVELTPLEAELCKLMTNAWRYIQFATANQFYEIAEQRGIDYQRVLYGCRHNYPRMAAMPGPGLAAGPCLVKDTMQLAAYSHNQFVLGHAAMLVNEGLPAFLVEAAKRRTDLRDKTAGILGMAFKAESDDTRDSLSYKLRKLLVLEAAEVVCGDPFVSDPTFLPLDEVVERSHVLFLATPHRAVRALEIPRSKIVIDVWGVAEQRERCT